MNEHSLEILLAAGVAWPLVAFFVLSLFGHRLGKPASGYLACAGVGASMILAAVVLMRWWAMSPAQRTVASAGTWVFEWAKMGAIPITLGIKLDSLTVIMFFMVSFVAFWIFVFSLGYMAGESDQIDGQSKFHRFFTFLSLFAFSMLGLVVVNSILFLYIFWELVGLCSYFLIGFYFHKKSASNAAIKAFVVNRVGDLGFLVGLMMVGLYLQDLSIDGAAAAFHEQYAGKTGLFAPGAASFLGLSVVTWMGILLFCGAIGKSAQFPLHVWLPDAMEGPTPVSALIHAATMVAAGVYLVARIFRLLTPEAQTVIAVIGCITLALAALIAIVQTDIKRVLAYSTISQLGYMIFGMGVGAWTAALFHLLTHAFFKALLFLGSGQVIEGCHHEQDIRKMGGLRRKMPVTCWTFFVATLAIAGAGIPWLGVGIGGYYSKDAILAAAYYRAFGGEAHAAHAGRGSGPAPNLAVAAGGSVARHLAAAESGAEPSAHHAAHAHRAGDEAASGARRLHPLLFWVPVIIAYVTAFYMMRCWWLTFCGRPRDEHVYEHAHESPLMYVPLLVLAVGTVVSGVVIFEPMVADAAGASADAALLATFVDPEAAHHAAGGPLGAIVGFAFVVGFAVAIAIYRNGLQTAAAIAARMRPLHTLLVKKFYFDEIYGWLFVGGAMLASRVSRLFDIFVIDFLVNLSASLTRRLSFFSGSPEQWSVDFKLVDGTVNAIGQGAWDLAGTVRRPQTGRIRNYVLFAAGSAAAILLVIVLAA